MDPEEALRSFLEVDLGSLHAEFVRQANGGAATFPKHFRGLHTTCAVTIWYRPNDIHRESRLQRRRLSA
jgi:hypothetical protein